MLQVNQKGLIINVYEKFYEYQHKKVRQVMDSTKSKAPQRVFDVLSNEQCTDGSTRQKTGHRLYNSILDGFGKMSVTLP